MDRSARSVALAVVAAFAVLATAHAHPQERGGDAPALQAQPIASTPVPQLACLGARESGLPLPSRFARDDDAAAFQDVLSGFLTGFTYEKLGWCEDKGLRDTGPYIDGTYYGTHPVVRIWYSPSFVRWLVGGRVGAVPDGAMIVKEQFDTPPAGQYAGWTREQIHARFEDSYD